MNPLLLGDPSPSLRWRAAVELDGAGEDDEAIEVWWDEVDRSDDTMVQETLATAGTPTASSRNEVLS